MSKLHTGCTVCDGGTFLWDEVGPGGIVPLCASHLMEYTRATPRKFDKIEWICPPAYERLENVLKLALRRAADGKGHKRHGSDSKFVEQGAFQISHLLGSAHGFDYQMIKKILEASRIQAREAYDELLDVIVYAAAKIIYLEEEEKRRLIGGSQEDNS